MEVLVAIAADEERQLLHYGLLEPLPRLEFLLLIVLSKLCVECPLENLVLPLDVVLPQPIDKLVSAFGADQELLSSYPLIAPPGIPGQFYLSVLIKIRIQRPVNQQMVEQQNANAKNNSPSIFLDWRAFVVFRSSSITDPDMFNLKH